MRRYFTRKFITYVLAFWFGTTIDWLIPRIMPGDPVQTYLARFNIGGAGVVSPGQWEHLYKFFSKSFGLNVAWIERVPPAALVRELGQLDRIAPLTLFKILRTQPDELGFAPDHRVSALADLPAIVAG